MNNALKKAVLFGVGAFYLTKDKVQDLVKELEAEGALDPKEGQELVKEVMARSEKRAEEIQKLVKAEVRRVMKELAEEEKEARPAEAEIVE